jgi:hypothetical protein
LDGHGSILGQNSNFSFRIASGPALRPTQPPIYWVPKALSTKVKRLGREAEQSPPSSVEVKNGGALPPLPICLHGIVFN